MADTTLDIMTRRFDELLAARDAVLGQSEPLRAQRDKIMNDARAAAEIIADQVAELEKDLPAIQTDLGRLSRALGGRSMSQSAR